MSVKLALVACLVVAVTVVSAVPLQQKMARAAKMAKPVAYTCAREARRDLLKDCKPYIGKCDAAQCAKKCTGYSCMSETVQIECTTFCDEKIMRESGCWDAVVPNARDFEKRLSICTEPYPKPKDELLRIEDPESSLECHAACSAYCTPFLCSLEPGLKRKCNEHCGIFKYENEKCQQAKPGPC